MRKKGVIAVLVFVILFSGCTIPQSNSIPKIESISFGWSHIVAVLSNGEVMAWGDNSAGQCDVPIEANHTIAVASGQFHNLALQEDGTVIAWGGQSFDKCDVPPDLKGVTAVAAGDTHSVALKNDELK